MHTTTALFALALSAASMVNAHGKVVKVEGDMGGNGTALGIMGGVIPLFGKNDATEKDTTVFGGNPKKPNSGGLGQTTAAGKLKLNAETVKATMDLSGSTLPQVSSTGGKINGTWIVVTSDGTANNNDGDLFAVLDTAATGKFSDGTMLKATTNLVGQQGNAVQRSIKNYYLRVMRNLGIRRRATNVGSSAEFKVSIPDGTQCTGVDPATGKKGVCLLKVANNNGGGPFGGSFLFQMAQPGQPGTTRRRAAFQA